MAPEEETGRRGVPSLLRPSSGEGGAGQEHIASDVTQLIGWTPLIELKRIAEKDGVDARIVGKIEAYQPLCSVKDRSALRMIEDAEEKGLISPGVTTLVEPTSGNLGLGLILVALSKGYRFVAVMPAQYSLDKQILLRYMGAELFLTDPALGFPGLVDKVEQLKKELPNVHVLDQFANPANPDAHVRWTGPEIWKDTAGKVDIFVAGSGSGGTVSGVGKYLKMQNPNVKIICVEPKESPVISGTGFVHTGDINVVWSHARKHGQQRFMCLYCGHTYNGGATTRLREHLSGMGNQVKLCDHVPDEVRDAMRNVRLEKMMNKIEEKKRDARFERELLHELRGHESIDVDLPSDDEGRLQLGLEMLLRDMKNQHEVAFKCGFGSGSVNLRRGPLDRFLSKRSSSSATSSIGSGKVTIQQRIDVVMDKTKVAKIGRAWAKWFHANDILGRKINCFYFRAALRLSMTLGLVEAVPKGHDVDGGYLEENCMEMEEYVKRCKDDWAKFGVSIMCDSWTGPTHMSIINFMVYYNTCMFFHKSIDASDKMQNTDFLCAEIRKVVDEIGHKKVVQIVTDNGANYKKACENLIEVYPHIIWQPCATHTINLILKDIGEFPEVDNVVQSAKQISRFFYNHNRLHDEMKKKIDDELIRPNATRFGTVFIFLQSFYDRKDKFQEWMVSPDWKNSDWRGLSDYEFTQNKLTCNKWWGKVKDIINTVEPLYFVLVR